MSDGPGRRRRRVAALADPAERPSTVQTAFWLLIATAVSSLVLNGAGFLLNEGAYGRAERSAVTQGARADDAHTAVVLTLVVSIGLTVLYSLLLAYFADRMRRGHPPARIAAVVVAAISLFGAVGYGAITTLIAAFAVVFCFLPPSNRWFASARGAPRP